MGGYHGCGTRWTTDGTRPEQGAIEIYWDLLQSAQPLLQSCSLWPFHGDGA